MTPAEQRVIDLIQRWLTSLDLHLKYSSLGDEAYRAVQPWPAHERPARWILDLAKEKASELKRLCDLAEAPSKEQFAEALELMAFLANLVGAQHVQRFIPLAEPQNERSAEAAPTPAPAAPVPPPASDPDRTREMPKLKPPTKRSQSATANVREPHNPAPAKPTVKSPVPETDATADADNPSATRIQANVLADAIRLMKWGRKWHELAPLIARMADRPAEAEVRKILRLHRADIESQLDN